MNEAVSERILDKIRKLMELSKNNPNANEAATAFAQAQSLLTKHRLTMAEVEAASSVFRGEQIVENAAPLYVGERLVTWKSHLANAIAKCNGCKVFIQYRVGRNSRKETLIVLVGRPSDMEIVSYLFDSVSQQIELSCKAAMGSGEGSGKTWSNNFKLGATAEVRARLFQAREEVRTEYKGSAALVLVDQRDAELEAWFKKQFPHLGKVAAAPVNYQPDAYQRGREAGKTVYLNKGLGSKK